MKKVFNKLHTLMIPYRRTEIFVGLILAAVLLVLFIHQRPNPYDRHDAESKAAPQAGVVYEVDEFGNETPIENVIVAEGLPVVDSTFPDSIPLSTAKDMDGPVGVLAKSLWALRERNLADFNKYANLKVTAEQMEEARVEYARLVDAEPHLPQLQLTQAMEPIYTVIAFLPDFVYGFPVVQNGDLLYVEYLMFPPEVLFGEDTPIAELPRGESEAQAVEIPEASKSY